MSIDVIRQPRSSSAKAIWRNDFVSAPTQLPRRAIRQGQGASGINSLLPTKVGPLYLFRVAALRAPLTDRLSAMAGHGRQKETFMNQFFVGLDHPEHAWPFPTTMISVNALRRRKDDFRVNMGEHKAVKRDDLPPDVSKILLNMKPGTISDLVQVQNACTIIRLNAHNQPSKLSFEQIRRPLQEELQKEKYEKLRSNLAKQLRAKAKIEIV